MEDIKLKDIGIDEFKKDVYSYYLEIFPEDERKPKIFSVSLCDEKVELWNNKFINISEDEDSHEKSVLMMKDDGIID